MGIGIQGEYNRVIPEGAIPPTLGNKREGGGAGDVWPVDAYCYSPCKADGHQ